MKLPEIIASLLAAQDKFDSKAFAENFSEDAIVHDEGKIHRGKAEIRKWNESTNAKYKTRYKPLGIKTKKNKITMKAEISGTFEGSPAIINYDFEIKEGKIHSLKIV